MKRIILTAVAAAAVLAGSVAAAAPAFASNGPAQFVTHEPDHPDTTSFLPGYPVAGQDATKPSPQGPVWAWDDLSVKLTPVALDPSQQSDGANYRVDITVTGSFAGFADPTTGAALPSSGPVKGTISYDVLATHAPDGAGLPAQEAGGLSAPGLHTLISQLFDGYATVVGGGDAYTFSYQNGNYTQVGAPNPGTFGDVRGH